MKGGWWEGADKKGGRGELNVSFLPEKLREDSKKDAKNKNLQRSII